MEFHNVVRCKISKGCLGVCYQKPSKSAELTYSFSVILYTALWCCGVQRSDRHILVVSWTLLAFLSTGLMTFDILLMIIFARIVLGGGNRVIAVAQSSFLWDLDKHSLTSRQALSLLSTQLWILGAWQLLLIQGSTWTAFHRECRKYGRLSLSMVRNTQYLND